MRLGRDELGTGEAPFFLLRLEWGGRVWRLSDRPVDVPLEAGDFVAFDGGLERQRLERALALFATDPGNETIGFDVHLDGHLEVIQAGFPLSTATGELSIWLPGRTWETRFPVITGRAVDPQWGARDEPVRFNLEQAAYVDRALWPPPGALVDLTTWPSHADNARGLVYPTVWGTPGVYVDSDGTASTTTGSPALFVDTTGASETLLIAGHRVDAANVTIVDGDGVEEVFAVTTTRDGRGREVSTVDISGAASITIDADADYWVIWHDGAGLLSERKAAGAVLNAGELLEWWLQRASIRVDFGRAQATFDALEGLPVDGYVDEAVVPWDYIADNLLPLMPVSITRGPDGLYPVVWRFEATRREALTTLEVGAGLYRSGLVEEEGAPIAEFRLSFAKSGSRREYRRLMTLSGDPASRAEGAYPNLITVASYLRYFAPQSFPDGTRFDEPGRPAVGVMETKTDTVYSNAGASYVLTWQSLAYALPHLLLTLDAEWRYAWLEEGSVVVLKDAELGIDRVALIMARAFGAGQLDLQLLLRLIENPSRDATALG